MRRTTAAVTFVLCLAAPAAQAYEDDVHYGLTRWLAQTAGFSLPDAETIARADVDYDRSGLSAIRLVQHSACFFNRDPVVSRDVRRIHFPSEGPVPGDPPARAVAAGSPAARSGYLRVLAVPGATDAANLEAFGQSLHPLQDSWSHQGVPDSPFAPVCAAALSWGHPVARGGFWSHDADLSHRYPTDAMNMAAATYSALCEYRSKLKGGPCTRPFADIALEVRSLVMSATKVAKAKWFKERGFARPEFLYATSVTDGDTGLGHDPVDYESPALAARRKSSLGALAGTEEARFMAAFFRDWMTRQDVTPLLKERIALDAYRTPLGRGDTRRIDAAAAEAQLRFWRVRDHGAMQQQQEGNHQLITLPGNRFTPIPEAIRRGDAIYPSVEDALLPLDRAGTPIVTWTEPGPAGSVLWVGAARLRHAPHDLVIVVADRVGGRYRVVSIDSIVSE